MPDADELEAHLDRPKEQTLTERLTAVLGRSDADLSATETLKLEVDRHASLDTLLGEYDVLAREAQIERWAAFLDVAPFPENVADEVFTSPYYESLEAALARHEAAGHSPTAVLAQVAPRLTPGDAEHDPAARLAGMIDQATQRLPQRMNVRTRRVAGLIPIPAEPIADEMQDALRDRRSLIEAAAHQLAQDAIDAGAAWTKRLGETLVPQADRARWMTYVATVALYRHRYGIHGPSPLGNVKTAETAEQAAESRLAYAAEQRARALSKRHPGTVQRRGAPQAGPGRRL